MRKEEVLQKLKHDRMLSKEIITTMRSSTSGGLPNTKKKTKKIPPAIDGLEGEGSIEAVTPYGTQDVFLSDSLLETSN